MFYIKPPRGQVAFHVLENCVYSRLEYLRLLSSGKGTDNFTGNFEYLLENSTLDSVGHFTLRLIAATSEHFGPSWIKSESLLLDKRLENMTLLEIGRFFRNTEKHLKERNIKSPVYQALIELTQLLRDPQVLDHIMNFNHSENCTMYKCEVPFTTVSELVKDRKVELRLGNATIVCTHWKTALLCLFKNFLEEEKNRLPHAMYLIASDRKFLQLKKSIDNQMIEGPIIRGYVTSRNIDIEATKFPLCMQNFHLILREKHRLSHQARFNYSIFLRECGLSLQDAIHFWRREYSKPHACGATCTHDWETSEKKYLYSIRHLYGLVGSRKTHKTPNCQMICNASFGTRYEGGCPFKEFDRTRLKTLLENSMTKLEAKELLENLSEVPEIACFNFFKVVHNYEDADFNVYNPVQYYKKVKAHEE